MDMIYLEQRRQSHIQLRYQNTNQLISEKRSPVLIYFHLVSIQQTEIQLVMQHTYFLNF